MLWIYNLIFFWGLSLVWFTVDMYYGYISPNKLNIYKCSPTTGKIMLSKYIKALPVVLRNQVISSISLYVFETYYRIQQIGYFQLFLNLSYVYIITNITFSVTHYLFHKYAYYIHKTHHEFKNPVCIATEYSSLIEHIINTSYIYTTIYMFDFTYNQLLFVIFMLNSENLLNHSGYKLRNKTIYHNIHHQLGNINFASSKWLEFLFKKIEKSK